MHSRNRQLVMLGILVVIVVLPLPLGGSQQWSDGHEQPLRRLSWLDTVLENWPICLVVPALVVLLAILRALLRETRDNGNCSAQRPGSDFVEAKYKTVICSLRAGTLYELVHALHEIAELQYYPYPSEVICELAMAAGKVHRYAYCEAIDCAMQCRLVRFLHLALEHNRAWADETASPLGRPTRDKLYHDRSFCRGLSPRKKRLGRELLRELVGDAKSLLSAKK